MKKLLFLLALLVPLAALGDRQFFTAAGTYASASTVTTLQTTVSTNTANITLAAKDKIVFGIGDGTNVITTGPKKVVTIPYDCMITGWTLVSDDAADTSGSIVLDVWKDTYANFPPTVLDTIINTGAGGVKPTITTSTKGVSASVANWTTAIAAGSVLRFNVDSVTDLKSVTLVISVTKP